MRGDIFLLQEVHLRDEEDLSGWWNGGRRRRAVSPSSAGDTRLRCANGIGQGWPSGRFHGRFNRREPVDWAVFEAAKERLRGLMEVRVKALAFQARVRELEEGERPTAYFFQASRVHREAPPQSLG
ncbi:hypothetical protein AAFF_G00315860 [Aldrovandia affinis]|uniref:Uncharacterized protein n=1 Tax=Aldrovandia affinis TaxID=143900 RepID=A0AAD7SPX0_9TELE|nr:hypothetical protein AAFF_G00315860 [Aldrovandia affinis]